MSNIYDLEYLEQGIYTKEDFKSYNQVFFEMNVTMNNLILNTQFLEQKNYLQMIGEEDQRFKFFNFEYVNNQNAHSNYLTLNTNNQILNLVSIFVNLTKNYELSDHINYNDIKMIKYN